MVKYYLIELADALLAFHICFKVCKHFESKQKQIMGIKDK